MNDLPKWKGKLIELLAGDEPVLLNWSISASSVKDGCVAVLIPYSGERIKRDADTKAVLIPSKNII